MAAIRALKGLGPSGRVKPIPVIHFIPPAFNRESITLSDL